MKILSNPRMIIGALVLGIAAIFSGYSLTGRAAEVEESTQTAIPPTVMGIWNAIDVQTVALTRVIQSNKLDDVHHYAFAIRDLVRALPEHYQELTTEQKQKLKEDVRFVDILATRLDQTGDAKDKAGTQSNFRKLEAVLKSIRNQYRIVK